MIRASKESWEERKNNDRMRSILITTFICARCGNPLEISYETPSTAIHSGDPGHVVTGGCKVDNLIPIHPCRSCYGAATEPIELMRKALKGMEIAT